MPSFERNNTYGKKNQTVFKNKKKEKPTLDYSLKQILNHNSLTWCELESITPAENKSSKIRKNQTLMPFLFTTISENL